MNALDFAKTNGYSELSQAGQDVDGNAVITLGVLNAVASNATVSQRSVAKDLGIALGLANSYVKRCIKKGLIKVQQVPANRYAYYLTPKGFSEKSRLTAEYLSQGFHFFRVARQEFDEIFAHCEQRGFSRILVHGLTDLTEIAVMARSERQVQIVAIIDDASSRTSYGAIPTVRALPDPQTVDAIVIADLGDPQQVYDDVVKVFPDERILIPALLHVVRRVREADEAAS